MEKTILVEKRNVYGNDLIYPLNYQQELFRLTGRKTLTHCQIVALQSMGFEFYERPPQTLKTYN